LENNDSQLNIPIAPDMPESTEEKGKPEGLIHHIFKKTEKKDKVSKIRENEATPIPISGADKNLKFEVRRANPPAVPQFRDKTKVDFRYPLIIPYAYAHIYWDASGGELIYKIEEPVLDDHEKDVFTILEKGIKELINISFISVKDEKTLIEYLEKNVRILLDELSVTVEKTTYLKIMYYLYRNFVGLNKIEPLMADPNIEDIECNGINSPMYIVHRSLKNLKTNITYLTIEELQNFVEKLAQKAGKYISYSNPLLDGTLPDKSRINATFTQDISSKGPTFTVRKFTKIPYTPIKLMELGTVSPEFLAYCWLLIEYGMNILIVGGTGSGKTSLLNGLAFFIPPQARVVSIEDTRELQLIHENWLPSIAREGVGLTTSEGTKIGEITLFDLLKESFRQRPDYVIVGEIRGKEAFVLFQGMASGHSSFSTMHANDVATVITRLETPPISLSASLVESLDAVIMIGHANIGGVDVRKVKTVEEVIKVGNDMSSTQLNTPFRWDPKVNRMVFSKKSYVFSKIIQRTSLTPQQLQLEMLRRANLLFRMYQKKIDDFEQVQKIINSYYKDPISVLTQFNLR